MHPLTAAGRQTGITLIESLVAVVIAALGILGILGLQMRTLADTQTGVRRAQAIRLIEDFSERTRSNPNSLGQIDRYVSGWDHSPPSPPSTTDCATTECDTAQMAAYNLAQWKAAVAQLLPLGKANIFIAQNKAGGQGSPAAGSAAVAGDQRQLGIMISWRENEKSSTAGYKNPIGVGSEGGDLDCPANSTCHLQYIPLSARCAPYFADAQVQFFCAGP